MHHSPCVIAYNEAERVETAWREVAERSEKVYNVLPIEHREAYYQLVLHPAKGSPVVARMNLAAGRNQLFAKQSRASTNLMAARV